MVKVLFLDVDGTLTTGDIFITKQGEIWKQFNVKDGLGISYLLPKMGIIPVVITGRSSEALIKRCEELGISEFYQGVQDKPRLVTDVVRRLETHLGSCAYIGDDLNDFECMEMVKSAGGIVACPANACEHIKNICDFVCNNDGGKGAVREFIDYLYSESCKGDTN